MQASKRERIILYGVVPITSAIVGAVLTVVLTRYFGTTPAEGSLTKMLANPQLSVQERLRVLQALKELDEPFWSFLRSILTALTVPLSIIVWDIGAWIRRRP